MHGQLLLLIPWCCVHRFKFIRLQSQNPTITAQKHWVSLNSNSLLPCTGFAAGNTGFKRMSLQIVLLLRISICSPLVLRAFAAHNMETGSTAEDDLEVKYRALVVWLLLRISNHHRVASIQFFKIHLCKSESRKSSDVPAILLRAPWTT